jgi:hypothetical protein
VDKDGKTKDWPAIFDRYGKQLKSAWISPKQES